MTTQIGAPTWFRPYIVMHSSIKMPASVRAPYRNVAILQTDGARTPSLIRTYLGAKIVFFSGPLHARGKQTAFTCALEEALTQCRTLNDACEIERMRAIGVPAWRIESVEAHHAA